jgi:hypothetical protein
MLIRAGVIAAAFGLCHVLGMRRSVSVFLATAHGETSDILRGGGYVLAYVATVMIAPILTLAAGIYAAAAFFMTRRGCRE